MDIYKFWKAVLGQNPENIRAYFDKDAYINWHCTNEHFNVEEFLLANDLFITVTHVYPRDKTLSFHVTSFIQVINDKIVAVDEYWADDGIAPNWRLDKQIGTPIR